MGLCAHPRVQQAGGRTSGRAGGPGRAGAERPGPRHRRHAPRHAVMLGDTRKPPAAMWDTAADQLAMPIKPHTPSPRIHPPLRDDPQIVSDLERHVAGLDLQGRGRRRRRRHGHATQHDGVRDSTQPHAPSGLRQVATKASQTAAGGCCRDSSTPGRRDSRSGDSAYGIRCLSPPHALTRLHIQSRIPYSYTRHFTHLLHPALVGDGADGVHQPGAVRQQHVRLAHRVLQKRYTRVHVSLRRRQREQRAASSCSSSRSTGTACMCGSG